MSEFGVRVRELRKAKGHTLRSLAPLVGVGFTYLSKVESGKLDFADTPSAELILRLAEALGADSTEMLLLAGRIPDGMVQRIRQFPREFMQLTECDDSELRRVFSELSSTS